MDEEPGLKPKQFKKDDPRIKIPSGKTTPSHDHLIVSKEPVETPQYGQPKYGQAYEHDRKDALHATERTSAGLAPKLPTRERKTRVDEPIERDFDVQLKQNLC